MGMFSDEYVLKLQKESESMLVDLIRARHDYIAMTVMRDKMAEQVIKLQKRLEECLDEESEDVAELKRMLSEYQGLAVECHQLKKENERLRKALTCEDEVVVI